MKREFSDVISLSTVDVMGVSADASGANASAAPAAKLPITAILRKFIVISPLYTSRFLLANGRSARRSPSPPRLKTLIEPKIFCADVKIFTEGILSRACAS